MEVDIMQKYNNKRSELIVAIHDMSADDLEQIVEAVKLRRTYLHKVATRSFTPGDQVQFTGKRGVKISGIVMKVAKKYVSVDCTMYGGSMWKVPGSHLERVAI
tara:strand:+ start:343 stop:651 length:309 start_codon:yes stop_codon:yes gene_type:complete